MNSPCTRSTVLEASAGPVAWYCTLCPRHRYTRFGRDVAGEWDGMPLTMDNDEDVGSTADVVDVDVDVERSRASRQRIAPTPRANPVATPATAARGDDDDDVQDGIRAAPPTGGGGAGGPSVASARPIPIVAHEPAGNDDAGGSAGRMRVRRRVTPCPAPPPPVVVNNAVGNGGVPLWV